MPRLCANGFVGEPFPGILGPVCVCKKDFFCFPPLTGIVGPKAKLDRVSLSQIILGFANCWFRDLNNFFKILKLINIGAAPGFCSCRFSSLGYEICMSDGAHSSSYSRFSKLGSRNRRWISWKRRLEQGVCSLLPDNKR